MIAFRRFPFVSGSLRQRLMLLFSILLLPPTALSLYFAWESFSEQKARAKLSVRQFASLAATYEQKFFDDARNTLQRLSDEPPIHRREALGCREILMSTPQDSPKFASLVLYDPSGTPVCGTNSSAAKVKEREWFQQVSLYRNFSISDYGFSIESPYPVIVAATAVSDTDGQFKGVLAGTIELHWLTAFIRDANLPSDSVFFLLDSSGNVLADRSSFFDNANPALPKKAANVKSSDALNSIVAPDLRAEIAERRLVDFEAIGNDNVRRVYSSVALPHGNVTVLFGRPAAATLGWLEKDLMGRIISLAAIWIMAIGGTWLITYYLVTRWTVALRRVALAYARGDYSAELKLTKAPLELRDLGETLMLMVRRVEAREADLKNSVDQKEVLLKEIHHRVKNNLQIVSSLLNIHSKSVSGSDARAAIEEVKARVRALALVHRYLFEGQDAGSVDLHAFITELCHAVMTSLSDVDRRISIEIDVPKLSVSFDRAVPVALLVTEALTNALKHAFPNRRTGTIYVSFVREGPNSARLRIADNGVGMRKKSAEGDSFGMSLIKAFAKQLGGKVGFLGPPGTTVDVELDTARWNTARVGPQPASPRPAAALPCRAEQRDADVASSSRPKSEPRHNVRKRGMLAAIDGLAGRRA